MESKMELQTKLTTDLVRAHAMSLDGDPTELSELLDRLIADSRGYAPAQREGNAQAAR